MLRYTRVVFAVNALYQTVLGLLCLLTPALAAGTFGASRAEQAATLLLVAFRMVGVNLVPMGVISAIIALTPEKHPVLRQLMGLVAVLNLVCWGVALSAHDLTLGQIGSVTLNAALQLLVVVAVVGYSPTTGVRQFIVRRRVAA